MGRRKAGRTPIAKPTRCIRIVEELRKKLVPAARHDGHVLVEDPVAVFLLKQ